jgi:hypothetical protein
MHMPRVFTEYPKDNDLAGVVEAAVYRVGEKLANLDANDLALSGNARKILCEAPRGETDSDGPVAVRRHPRIPRARWALRNAIERAARTFAWALPDNEKPFSDLAFVTLNDGFGLLSLIARECNVGTIVHAHTDDERCDDARLIGKATGNRADDYICGDIEDVHFYVKRTGMSCDVFVSRDGIGEAPDPDLFFETLFDLSENGFSFGFDSIDDSRGPADGLNRCDEAALIRRHLLAAGFRVDRFLTSAAEKRPLVPRLKGSLSDLALRLVRRCPSEHPPDTSDRFAIFGIRPPRLAIARQALRMEKAPRTGAAALQPA